MINWEYLLIISSLLGRLRGKDFYEYIRRIYFGPQSYRRKDCWIFYRFVQLKC